MSSFQNSSGKDTEIITQFEKNYQEIQLAINSAAACAGRDPDEVLLVAVSKAVGIPEIETAIKAGISDFGENRTHSLREKQNLLPSKRWHYIGHIQTNKLKDLVGRAHLIHSVASLRALNAISRLAEQQEINQKILIEVNVSGEESKDGLAPSELPNFLEAASTTQNIEVKGFMTMAPLLESAEDKTARQCFAALRELRDNLVPIFAGAENISLNELSMGMSGDFSDAIQEGATIVRIGRRLWS
ncbi:MAG: YggS family pyridoxal phosphate-dependent enzyme [Coriobacteriia bacterium]|nr:YggS family pyridoxal phosphate-dependent enzyme [Coriobacteriia bacterium]